MYVLARSWIGLRMPITVTLVSHMYISVPQQTEPLTTSAPTFGVFLQVPESFVFLVSWD